ncbi:MAG: SirB2 family protein [Gammaproteobacteria bacterium]|nr:SirB2 family protein [Gammaproteobacteria bacterium]
MPGLEVVKQLHVACAAVSGVGFFLRGVLMLRGSPLLRMPLLKIAPHVVDTLLLLSAILLAAQWGWAALGLPWLQAKIIALLLYIGLGMVALRRGKTRAVRGWAWLGALAVFGYIVAVALTRTPLVVV